MKQAELDRIYEAALQYRADEKDLRGFVPEKGWAHSAAHTGDLLFALGGHPGIGAGGHMPRHKAYVAGQDNVRYHNTECFLQAVHLMVTYQDVPQSVRDALLPAVHAVQKSFAPWWV